MSGLESEASAEICINLSCVTATKDTICLRSHINGFTESAVFPLNEFRQFSNNWVHSLIRRAVIVTESNSTLRKEMLCV